MNKIISNCLLLLIVFSIGYWISQIAAPTSIPAFHKQTYNIDIEVPIALKYIFDSKIKIDEIVEDIELKGLIEASNKKESVAVISINKKPVEYYRVNETIRTGMKISNIATDHVVIDENGITRQIVITNINELVDK